MIMPDHIHFFCAPTNEISPLEKWLKFWKADVTRTLTRQNGAPVGEIWQTNHWDWQIRTAAQYTQKWEYVRDNPVRKNLVKNRDEWKWQGEIHELTWR